MPPELIPEVEDSNILEITNDTNKQIKRLSFSKSISDSQELNEDVLKLTTNPTIERISDAQSQTNFQQESRSIMTETNFPETNQDNEEASEQGQQTWKIIIRQMKN